MRGRVVGRCARRGRVAAPWSGRGRVGSGTAPERLERRRRLAAPAWPPLPPQLLPPQLLPPQLLPPQLLPKINFANHAINY